MTTFVGLLIVLVVGFCFGRLSALEAPEVKRITAMYLELKQESLDTQEELEASQRELIDVKQQLSGLGVTISNLSK